MPALPQPFRALVSSRPDGPAVVRLFGELDVASIDDFEHALASVVSTWPEVIVVDCTGARFISVDGYSAIGRLRFACHTLLICAPGSGELCARVLGLLGFRVSPAGEEQSARARRASGSRAALVFEVT